MNSRGRPVLGAVAGFFFGVFLALTLLVFGVVALDNILLGILPLVFLVVGIAWALWAPLGGRSHDAVSTPVA